MPLSHAAAGPACTVQVYNLTTSGSRMWAEPPPQLSFLLTFSLICLLRLMSSAHAHAFAALRRHVFRPALIMHPPRYYRSATRVCHTGRAHTRREGMPAALLTAAAVAMASPLLILRMCTAALPSRPPASAAPARGVPEPAAPGSHVIHAALRLHLTAMPSPAHSEPATSRCFVNPPLLPQPHKVPTGGRLLLHSKAGETCAAHLSGWHGHGRPTR